MDDSQGAATVLVTPSAWLYSLRIDTAVSAVPTNSRVEFLVVFVNVQKHKGKILVSLRRTKDGMVCLFNFPGSSHLTQDGLRSVFVGGNGGASPVSLFSSCPTEY